MCSLLYFCSSVALITVAGVYALFRCHWRLCLGFTVLVLVLVQVFVFTIGGGIGVNPFACWLALVFCRGRRLSVCACPPWPCECPALDCMRMCLIHACNAV